MGNSFLEPVSASGLSNTPLTRATEPDARRLLSDKAFNAIQDRSFEKTIDILQDVYDKETNPEGWVNLGVAENTLMHKELVSYINTSFSLTDHDLTYGDGGYGSKRLRSALASFLATQFNPRHPISPENIACTPGVTIAMEMTAAMLANPGEGFLLGRPYYSAFPRDLGLRSGVKAVTVSFESLDCFDVEAVARYEDALRESERQGVKIRGLIVCSPHNPLGRCYPRETLVALMKLCQKYQIHLLSDEIYALSVWCNPENPQAEGFTSVLEIEIEGLISSDLVHVFWGLSKDFGANGLRLGCVISRCKPFIDSLHYHSVFLFPSSAVDVIASRLLSDTTFLSSYIKESRSRISIAHVHATDIIRKHNISYNIGINAGSFLWVRLRGAYLRNRGQNELLVEEDGAKLDEEINNRLLERKVYLNMGIKLGGDVGGWWRLVFTHPNDYVDEGLKRMWEAIS